MSSPQQAFCIGLRSAPFPINIHRPLSARHTVLVTNIESLADSANTLAYRANLYTPLLPILRVFAGEYPQLSKDSTG